ncbi:hypothetical protein HDF19_06660 [Mucilaginibacter sp. E4BP6]|uniref:hypothetical protein n=1 Tax=Mucilaginibacter sp. E4BP6 TaxID=2723089 RepID=UPI0015CB9FF0|nr:hypothetical protein [Mucilaginibacter sp. E4BP6]NYE68409.1 hypothetical protein [Mucilaginibacter sp. E4BP6]
MIRFTPPALRSDFIIVVRRGESELAATALSFLFQSGSYLPMFAFTDVDVPADAPVVEPDIYGIQRRRAEHFSIFLNNVIIQNGGCQNLILLGLTDNQLSYLDYLDHYNVLQIGSAADLDAYLGGFAFDKQAPLVCSSEQYHQGCVLALQQNRLLQVGFQNVDLETQADGQQGVVVIERMATVETVIAINYAASIGAKIILVDEMQERENEKVLYLLEEWHTGDQNALDRLQDQIGSRIGGINFDKFEFATFFTEGLPYSLFVRSIPVSYVNLEYRPDFFIHNSFKYERNRKSGSAVIFSPVFFKDEETSNLLGLLEFKNYYLRKLTAGAATNYNLKNTIESYPFDLLHICSHGGDVRGIRSEVRFRGAEGATHTIEFDFILTIALTPYQDMHSVETLYFFKKLDGLPWRSPELHAKGYSHELYAGISGAISTAFKKKTVIRKHETARVTNANAINCVDFNYLANFSQIASDDHPPLIFNNTCWSWMSVSTSFLTDGARAYIGTFFSVPNSKAVVFAETFYDQVFDANIIDGFHTANTEAQQDGTTPFYMFWGLHFSTLNNTNTVRANREFVLKGLSRSHQIWRRKRDAGEGAKDLLEGRVSDTLWMLNDVFKGSIEGHTPTGFRSNRK